MELEEVYPNLFHVEFQSSEDLTKSFVRLHGHYETPKFRNKFFSVEDYNKWFSKIPWVKEAQIKLSHVARGFNVPKYSFLPFFEGKFDPLSEEEKTLLDLVDKLKNEDYYIISSLENDYDNFKHEVSHGLFYLNKNYKREVKNELSQINENDYWRMWDFLKQTKLIHKKIMDDEMHAHLLTNYSSFVDEDGQLLKGLEKYVFRFEKIFSKYSNGIKGL